MAEEGRRIRGFSRRQFASDNAAGICPEAWEALAEANEGHAPAYGEDAWTQRASDRLRELFETGCEVFFVFNGTAANSLALASLCQSYHSIVCAQYSHVEVDECGAPEFFSNGTKILLVPGDAGKLDPEAVKRTVTARSDIHFPKPKVLSLTQATEMGTVYSVAEMEGIAEIARRHDLRVHMDGARFANAIEFMKVAPREITWEAGVDVLCLGGTKNGLPYGEAVVFFDREAAREFDYRCKQAGQLASKMRFLSAPWVRMIESGAWLRNAARANGCARRLEAELRKVPGVEVMYPVQANSVFARLPEEVEKGLLRKGWVFYTHIGRGGARLMCSWDTSEDDVAAFVQDARELAG